MIRRLMFSLAAVLIGLLAIGYIMQRSLLFPAPKTYSASPPAGYDFVETRTSDGLTLKAAYRSSANNKPVLVFFHGNGDSLNGASIATRQLVEAGYGAMLFEYRGYGGNAGSPNEQGFYRDGEAAISWLSKRGIGPQKLVFVGNSIGSGPATEMAVRHQPKALILISGFASLPSVVANLYPFLPTNLIIRDKFDSESKLAEVSTRILLLHGSADRLVQPIHSERLKRANATAKLIILSGFGHELAYQPTAQEHAVRWLSDL